MAIQTHGNLAGADPHTAGDTLLITESLSGYSAATWTLYYVLKQGADVIRLKSTASGTDHAFSEGSSVTGKWKAGQYIYQKYVEDTSGQRETIDSGTFHVNPNIAQVDPEIEQWRSVLKFAVDAIERLAKERTVSYSVAGQSFTLTSVSEAKDLIRFAKRQVKDLDKEERRSAGLQSSNKIQFRM